MTRKLRRLARPAMLVAAMGMIAAGCGGGGDTTTVETQARAGGTSGGATLEIKMGDYFFAPANAQAKAGQTLISAPNEGAVEHELVLFKTNMDPAKLPTEADGSVDEEKMDKAAEEAGEIADVEVGETKSGTFKLTPGKYAMFCNLPGHYAQGMYGTITVSK